jgi:UDP-2,4-diacetamido-2,4,6-trideoxy-beta-L-altropyranose hydrolase
LAAAGPKIGLGHLMRCLAVAELVEEAFEVTFVNHQLELQAQQRIADCGFRCAVPTVTDAVLLVDGYQFTAADIAKYITPQTQVAWISDFNTVPPLAAAIINHAPTAKRMDYRAFYGFLGLGLPYAMVAPRFFEQPKVAPTSNTALVCLGGSDWNNLTHTTARWILEESAFDVEAVVGPFYTSTHTLESLKAAYPERFRWHTNLNQNQLAALMHTSAFGVFSASNTLYEACAAHLPAIAGYYTENQLGIYNGFEACDAIWGCANFDAVLFQKQLQDITAVTIAQKKRQLQALWTTTPGKQWQQLLKQLAFDGSFVMRKAAEQDCELLWKWANDPTVRMHAFSTAPIPFEDHERWFNQKLGSSAHLYVMEQHNEPVGQIRFDFKDGIWWVDYSIAATFRGQSLSKTLLRRGLLALRMAEGSVAVRASVKKNNLPSMRAFEAIHAHLLPNQPQDAIVTYDLSI